MPYIKRPTENAAFRRLDAQDRLTARLRHEPPISALDREFLRADRQSPTGGAYRMAQLYRLPQRYIERRLRLFTFLALLEELQR